MNDSVRRRDRLARPLRLRAAYWLAAGLALLAAVPAAAQVQWATIAAHPVLWTVRSKTATVYLFGSIHLLPATVVWHTPQIDHAMADANVFVFEAPIDDTGKAQVAEFLRKNGMLPAGVTLRSLLNKTTLADYDHALATAHLPANVFDGERPWLAALALDVAYLQQMRYVVADGVDQQVFAYARAHGKQVRYFETPEQQLSLFLPADSKTELQAFDADLKAFQPEQETIGAMVDAWGDGDVKTVARLMNKDLDSVPGEKKILIDDRNKTWVKTLDDMLASESTYFVTVGTGHLVGPRGVPGLLRAQHYQVDGP